MTDASTDDPRPESRGRSLDPGAYPEAYFLSEDVEGYAGFRSGRLSWLREKHLSMLACDPGHRVLELGFARGELLYALVDRCALAVGLDFSPAACRLAASLGAGRSRKPVLVRGDCRYLPFADNQFDRVFAGDLIEHLDYAGGTYLLREMARMLKPGGLLLAHTTPNLVFHRVLWPRLIRPILRWFRPGTVDGVDAQLAVMDRVHIQEYTPTLLRRVARDAGLVNPAPEIWVDPDLLRAGSHRLTGDLARSLLYRIAAPISRPFHRWIGNDLYLRWRKP